MPTFARFLDQVPVNPFEQQSSAVSINTGSFMITGSVSGNVLTFTKGDSSTFDLPMAASASSADAVVTASVSASTMTFTKGDSSTFDVALPTSSGDITYNTSASQVIQDIVVKDFDNDVAVTFVGGTLTFIFGTPTPPTPSLNNTGDIFITDRFNKVFDTYNVVGSFNLGAYNLISASLLETTAGSEATLQGPVGIGSSLSTTPNTTGSRSYKLIITSSNPSDGAIVSASVDLNLNLNKLAADIPTVSTTATAQLGVASNQIEVGATGNISYTSSKGANERNWVFVDMDMNYPHNPVGPQPTNVSGSILLNSYGETQQFLINATAAYSSSGTNGSDNSPALYPGNSALASRNSANTVYTRIKSVRAGASVQTTFTINELYDLAAWDTTLGGTIGTIAKGTTNPNNHNIDIIWTGDKYQYIVYDASQSNLATIKERTTQFDVLPATFGGALFATVGGYKIYRSTNPQSGYAGTTAEYVLNT